MKPCTPVLLLVPSTGLPALAAEPSMEAELEALRTYCRPDIERFCPDVEPGGGRIKECLKEHKEQISVGCAQALQKLKKEL
ncbi:MAG: cysteine rich repeat-containing protein [Bdellovibrio bacteriovorus]